MNCQQMKWVCRTLGKNPLGSSLPTAAPPHLERHWQTLIVSDIYVIFTDFITRLKEYFLSVKAGSKQCLRRLIPAENSFERLIMHPSSSRRKNPRVVPVSPSFFILCLRSVAASFLFLALIMFLSPTTSNRSFVLLFLCL